MNNLKQDIELLQTKVDEYQKDLEFCAALSLEQCTILAELQTIFNTLSKNTVSNVPSLYNCECIGVTNQMKQFTKMYAAMDAKTLYDKYIEKYKKAKGQPYNLIQLFDISRS